MDMWKAELTPEMMPDGLCRTIAEEIGTENLLKLLRIVGGATVYLPLEERVLRPLRDKKIREEYNGYNVNDLARKYDVTTRWILKIVGGKKQ